MKKMLLALAVMMLLSGCNAEVIGSPHITQPETTVAQQQEKVTALPFSAEYVRTDGFYYYSDTGYPHVVAIDSMEAARRYYLNLVPHDFGSDEPTISTGVLKPLVSDKYTEEFFAEQYLIYVILEEPSGSISHTVQAVEQVDKSDLRISINRNVPEVGTDDMAYWHIVLELPRSNGIVDAKNIDVLLDGVLAYDGTPVIPGTAQPIYTEPPTGQLHHPNGVAAIKYGGYYWEVEVDGQKTGTKADGEHPLQCEDYKNPIVTSTEYVKIDFPDFPYRPNRIQVCYWPGTAWGKTDTPAESVLVSGTTFNIRPGMGIYLIRVSFSDFGSVDYYAYIDNYISDIS